MAYYFPICNILMDMTMTNSELMVWLCLGALYTICGLFTIFIIKGEK